MRTRAAFLTIPLLAVTLSGQQPAAPAARRCAAAAAGGAELSRDGVRADSTDGRRRPPARLAAARPLSRRQPGGGEAGGRRVARRVHGRLDHRRLAERAVRRLLRDQQGLHRPRHQRPDHAADAAPLPARRHRPETEGGRHPRRHQRHRRQHRPDDQRGDPGQHHVDGGAGPGQQDQGRAVEHPPGQQLPRRSQRSGRRRRCVRWSGSVRSTTG